MSDPRVNNRRRASPWLAAALAWGAATVAVASLTAGLTAPPARAARAHAASTARVRDEGRLRLVRSSGSLLVDEGSAHGTFPGTVRVDFVYNGSPNVSARIWIYGRAGTIYARGSARLSSPTSASPSFAGTITIVSGSGRYTRARGSGGIFGVFYRRSYGMIVQTQGTFRY